MLVMSSLVFTIKNILGYLILTHTRLALKKYMESETGVRSRSLGENSRDSWEY